MQVEMESAAGEQEEEHEKEDTPEAEPDNRDQQPSEPIEPEQQECPSAKTPDHGEEAPPEVQGDQTLPGSSTDELQQCEEGKEIHKMPAGESQPSAAADGDGTESIQEPLKHHETLESHDSSDTSKQPEEPAVDGEVQVMGSSGEAAEEITQPEVPELGKSPPSEGPSQELGASDMDQDTK